MVRSPSKQYKKQMDINWAEENDQIRAKTMIRRHEEYLRTSENRPYIQMCAVGDSRDHSNCSAIDGVVAHGKSDWATSNWPPHRKGCRCTIRTLNDRQLIKENLKISYKLENHPDESVWQLIKGMFQ